MSRHPIGFRTRDCAGDEPLDVGTGFIGPCEEVALGGVRLLIVDARCTVRSEGDAVVVAAPRWWEFWK